MRHRQNNFIIITITLLLLFLSFSYFHHCSLFLIQQLFINKTKNSGTFKALNNSLEASSAVASG